MISRTGFIKRSIEQIVARTGSLVTLEWSDFPGGTTVDPVTQSVMGTAVPQTLDVRVLVHFVQASAVERTFAEIQVGDVIVDFPASVDLTGKVGLRVVIDGVAYVQKDVGDLPVQFVDAMISDQTFLKPVLLRKAT